MAATNVLAHRVHGPAVVLVGTGSNNALETLGVTLDGASIRLTHHRRDVHNDVGGPDAPVDRQDMGSTARISVTLVDILEDTLRKLEYRSREGNGQAPTFGDITPRGRLVGADGKTFRVQFVPQLQTANTYWEDGWHFYYCDMDQEPVENRIGTVVTNVRLSFFAFPYIAANVANINAVSGATYGKCYSRFNFSQTPT